MDSRHLRGCCGALLTFFSFYFFFKLLSESWVWAVRFTDYFSLLYLSTAFKILLWGSRDFCWNMSNPIGIFVICASNLIHISLAFIIKSKFKPTLTFRSGFRSHLSPWRGLLQAISERSGGGLFAIMRRNSAASEARWQIVAIVAIVATQLFHFFISLWNRWWMHYGSASMINEGPSWLGSR